MMRMFDQSDCSRPYGREVNRRLRWREHPLVPTGHPDVQKVKIFLVLAEWELTVYRDALPQYCRLVQDGIDDNRIVHGHINNDISSRVKRLTINSEINDQIDNGTVVRYADDAWATGHDGRRAPLDRDVPYLRMASMYPSVNEHGYLTVQRTFFDFKREALTTDMHNEL